MKKLLVAFVLLFVAANLVAQDYLLTVRLNLVKDPISKKYGYAFKEQNVLSPIHGATSAAINMVGKAGSQLIGKSEAENIDWAVPPQYQAASAKFCEGLAMVQVGGKVGFIDIYNRFIIQPIYDGGEKMGGFHNGMVAVKQLDKWGVIDKQGAVIIPFEYDDLDNFNDNYVAAAKRDGKWGAIDLHNDMVVPFEYNLKQQMTTLPVSNKPWLQANIEVCEMVRCGHYNALLDAICVADEAAVERMETGNAELLHYEIVGRTDVKGVIDQYGRHIVPIEFQQVVFCEEDGVWMVLRNGLWGAYLYNGVRLIRPCFHTMKPFVDGRSEVTCCGVEGWIDVEGNLKRGFLSDLCKAGIEYEKLGNNGAAMGVYEMVLDISPDYAIAYNNIGLLNINDKDYTKGINKIKLAHKLDPENETIARNLQIVKEQRKERRAARWEAALSIAMAVVDAASTSYATYSAVNGGGGATPKTVSGPSGSSGSSSSKSSAASSCKVCKGSGNCTSVSSTADRYYCHGSGKCKHCLGDGFNYAAGQRVTCTACHGSGKCKQCNGSGKCKQCHGSGKG